MIIGINFSYDRDGQPLYECVTLGTGRDVVEFATGDPVADYTLACLKGRELYGQYLMLSSSCDEFVTLMNEAIEWTEDGRMVWAEGSGPPKQGVNLLDGLDSIFDGLDDVQEAYFRAGDLWASHMAALEEAMDLHNYLGRLFTGEANLEEIKEVYDKAWPLPAGEGYVPRGIVALKVIERMAFDLGHKRLVSSQEVLAFVAAAFRFAHAGLGMCEDSHDEWVVEMIHLYNNFGFGQIDINDEVGDE